MKLLEYKTQIAYAATASELHEIRSLAESDLDLTPAERSRVGEAVGKRFAQLNRAAMNWLQPRWASGDAAKGGRK